MCVRSIRSFCFIAPPCQSLNVYLDCILHTLFIVINFIPVEWFCFTSGSLRFLLLLPYVKNLGGSIILDNSIFLFFRVRFYELRHSSFDIYLFIFLIHCFLTCGAGKLNDPSVRLWVILKRLVILSIPRRLMMARFNSLPVFCHKYVALSLATQLCALQGKQITDVQSSVQWFPVIFCTLWLSVCTPVGHPSTTMTITIIISNVLHDFHVITYLLMNSLLCL